MLSDLIIDVGLNRGEDTEFYLKKGFRVVAIEANPALTAAASERFSAEMASSQLRIVHAAVAEKSGPVTFFSNDRVSDWGTTSREWMERNAKRGAPSQEITVPGRPFADILREVGMPYYLKVDIEGLDMLCVRAIEGFAERPKFLSFESTMTSWKDLVEEFAVLRRLGYKRFKIVNQLKVPAQTCVSPAREGKYVSHVFVHGSSGNFGEEAPGEWMSERRALMIYRAIFVHYRIFGPEGVRSQLDNGRFVWRFKRLAERYLPEPIWFDTHATF